MAVLKTGEYRITFYDKYGNRLKDFTETGTNVIKSQARGYEVIASGNSLSPRSFTVDLRVFNSLDKD